ncbi:hypothetical protein [Cellulosimicrobium sp. TH-20]|uniref:hypothetical protein n=1 Tax=Cellulosimicrobium sp. TH-20 TaxID=1980001 RepID=UPI001642D120|nr:hypothetical protein [Cellulosimicrobium sp. TH-20]
MPAGWSVEALMTADLYHAHTGKPHPARPEPKKSGKTSRTRALLERLKAQKARLGGGPSTA